MALSEQKRNSHRGFLNWHRFFHQVDHDGLLLRRDNWHGNRPDKAPISQVHGALTHRRRMCADVSIKGKNTKHPRHKSSIVVTERLAHVVHRTAAAINLRRTNRARKAIKAVEHHVSSPHTLVRAVVGGKGVPLGSSIGSCIDLTISVGGNNGGSILMQSNYFPEQPLQGRYRYGVSSYEAALADLLLDQRINTLVEQSDEFVLLRDNDSNP